MPLSYSEKLRDPRWQKKRLEVMQRDKFTCQECDTADKTLNVHHCFYEWGHEPWDYPDSSLVTLCEDCHSFETDDAPNAKKSLIKQLSSLGCRFGEFQWLSYIIWRNFEDQNRKIKEEISGGDLIRRICLAIDNPENDEEFGLGGETNSSPNKSVPTGEGSSAGDMVERKSDATV